MAADTAGWVDGGAGHAGPDQWQRKFDREFPDGATCSWELPAEHTPVIYVTQRIEVIDMAGLDPVVRIVPLDNSRVLGPARVTSYSPAHGGRWAPGTMRVTLDEHYPGVMYWSPKVPDVLKRQLGDAEPDSSAPEPAP